MSSRKPICHACRRRQRGCIWPTKAATVCVRCTKLNLKCIPSEEIYDSDNDDDILPKEFAVKAIKYWSHQIDQLETDMQRLEHTTQNLSKLTSSGGSYDDHTHHRNDDGNDISDDVKKASADNNNLATKATMENYKGLVSRQPPKQFEWKLSIRDGLLKLHSKVDTIEELLQYSHAFLEYLAPFEGVFQKSIINLDSMSYNILIRTFRIIFRLNETKGRSPSSSLSSHLSLRRVQQQTIPQLQSYLHRHYQFIIDHLINTYCERENSRRIFLHIPAFREHYRKLKDPLTCPITLAVCIHTLCTSKRIITHSATELRELADYLYAKCKKILYDMFDDPARKIETIVVINFLQHFMIFVLLRFNEARRWSTVAYSLCKDLESDLHQKTQRQQHNACLPLDMQKILLQRHFFYIENMLQLLSFMLDTKMFGQGLVKLDMKVAYLEVMPGEDTTTSVLIEAHNRLLQLSTSPYMAAITTQMKNIADSTSNPERFIDILVRLDTTIRDWWSELPACLRLCDDLYAEDAEAAIEQNNSVAKAIVFSFVHSILFRIYAFVLDLDIEAASNDDDNSIVGDGGNTCQDEKKLLFNRAKSSATVRSCELVLRTVTRMFTLHEDVLPFMFEFISRAIYTLLSVSFCSKKHLSSDLREKFFECFDVICNAFPPDNIVPPSISPLHLYIKTYQMDDTDIYQKYPLPGYALLADLVNTSCAYLKSDYFQSFQEPLNTYLKAYTCSALYGNFCFME
ncbi:hypothetical protein BDB00DRAFT_851140 [Zychaea mexicana]|uniref:uncharacterized protein n=1 Tax=Zychaea mexicana TaxID=64656 RepID=UPI0022FE9829|nr:uncharacterized protein BDB00DRAFT_851140 [Zychaea mexicana]KAI9485125.1 hypothetical protein BDB00DRAFT_851140 [Zychaea mexicana]